MTPFPLYLEDKALSNTSRNVVGDLGANSSSSAFSNPESPSTLKGLEDLRPCCLDLTFDGPEPGDTLSGDFLPEQGDILVATVGGLLIAQSKALIGCTF